MVILMYKNKFTKFMKTKKDLDKNDDKRILSFKEIKLYIKPQDFTAYYVVNDDYSGKVGLF